MKPRPRILDCAGICEDCPDSSLCTEGCRNPDGTREHLALCAEMDAAREPAARLPLGDRVVEL